MNATHLSPKDYTNVNLLMYMHGHFGVPLVNARRKTDQLSENGKFDSFSSHCLPRRSKNSSPLNPKCLVIESEMFVWDHCMMDSW
jgi:hypothetical protein